MAGIKGQLREPQAPVRERRNTANLAEFPQWLDPAHPIELNAAGILTLKLGDGLALDSGNVVIDVAASGGLGFDSGQLTVEVQDVLAIDASGIKLDYGDGLENDGADNLQAAIGDGLTFASGDIEAALGDGMTLVSGAIEPNVGDGLSLGAAIAVQPRDDSLLVDGSGVGVQIRDDSLWTDASGLGVQVAPDGGINVAAEGLEIIGGIPIETEVPAGTKDGSNTSFTLSDVPAEGEVLLFLNGLLMFEGEDFTRSGTDITMSAGQEPLSGENFLAVYLKGTGASGEVPTGTQDGANQDFTLANTPEPTSLFLFVNGVYMRQGASHDYTLTDDTISFNAGMEPLAGENMWAAYQIEDS